MKADRSGPQPLVAAVGEISVFRQLRLGVPEQGPEEEDLQRHPPQDAHQVVGVLEIVLLDERQALLLATGRGDPEGNRRAGPLEDAIAEPQEEQSHGGVRNDHPEYEFQIRPSNPERHNQQKNCNCESSDYGVHLPTPRAMRISDVIIDGFFLML